MVKFISNRFICEACGFRYKEKEWAEKCEEFCRKYHSCNPEITKHAAEAP